MPAYEIIYRHDDGSLTAKIETHCASDKEAKILAHAMKMDGAHQLEVRQGETLIYSRPQDLSQKIPISVESRLSL
ncbi:MAG TPA: hypothetical protein VID67_03050 [Rhizomicrobium sp.]